MKFLDSFFEVLLRRLFLEEDIGVTDFFVLEKCE